MSARYCYSNSPPGQVRTLSVTCTGACSPGIGSALCIVAGPQHRVHYSVRCAGVTTKTSIWIITCGFPRYRGRAGSELSTLVSRLHGTLLDRHRPLWEFHLIEGLADSRFAFYFKVHHALVDGVNSTRQIAQMLSAEPTAPLPPPIWAERNPADHRRHPSPSNRQSVVSSRTRSARYRACCIASVKPLD